MKDLTFGASRCESAATGMVEQLSRRGCCHFEEASIVAKPMGSSELTPRLCVYLGERDVFELRRYGFNSSWKIMEKDRTYERN